MQNNNVLDGLLFTFNSHTGNWRVVTRDQYIDCFNTPETNFPRSSSINTLIEMIEKGKLKIN